MRRKSWLRWSFLVALTFFVMQSCRREFDPPIVENELLAPLVHTRLNIQSLVADSLREEGSDGLISLVYRNALYEASMDVFEELTTREFERTARLKELKLSQRVVKNSVSLGEVAQTNTTYGPLIIALNGNTFAIPEITGLSAGPDLLDGSAYFDEMTLDSGFMTVTIENGFPTSISDIVFEITNQQGGQVIVLDTFASIPSLATQSRTTDLAGKSIEAALEAMVVNFDIDASSGPVLIDTSDRINVTITIGGLKVYSAIAVFPAQNIIDAGDINPMNGVGDVRITKATAKKGTVHVEVQSTIEDTLYFDYYIPEGLYQGQSFEVHETINPAPPGGSISKVYEYDVAGYTFGMTGYPIKDSSNVFYSRLVGRIDSTGRKVNITLDDSVRVFVHLSGFVPEYIEGYAGDTVVQIGPEKVPFELFNKMSAGTLEFEDVKMNVSVLNGNNVPFDISINSLKAANTRTGKSVDINLGSLPNPIEVFGAPSLYVPWQKSWSLTQATNNVNSALAILPNQFEAALTIRTNPDENSDDLGQFAVDSNVLAAYADIEVPLAFIASDLVLRDTLDFDGDSKALPEGIEAGTLYLIAKNTMPLSAEIEVTFLAADGTVMKKIAFDGAVAAGDQNATVMTVLEWDFDGADFDQILSSTQVVMQAKVNTASVSEPVKIYSTMGLELNLSTRFDYTLNLKKR